MHRHDVMSPRGGGLAVPALFGRSPAELKALGHRIHCRLRTRSRSPRGPLGPFNAHQHETLGAIVEAILEADETARAEAARLDEFIAVMLEEWYDEVDRIRFLQGLGEVDRRCWERYGHQFTDGTPDERRAVLDQLDTEVERLRILPGRAERHFFSRICYLTRYGLATAEGPAREPGPLSLRQRPAHYSHRGAPNGS